MRTHLLTCTVLAALGVGGFVGSIVASSGATPDVAAAAADPALVRSLNDLTTEVAIVKSRLETLELRPAVAPAVDPADRAHRGATREAEARAAIAPEPQKPVDPAAEKAAAVAAAAKELSPQLEKLLAAGVPADDLRTLLAGINQSGSQEGAIAAAQALVEKNPNDPKAHYVLAKACYARCMLESTPAGFEKWGGMTLAAWEKSSEIDPNYWEPRFERAEYLTYYPESEGKTPEVITAFEDLIKQQGGSSSNPRYAKSYAHLSRMYLRVGDREQAIRTLRDGVALFPKDSELQKQLAVLEKH